MGRFYIHRDGRLLSTGSCPDGQEPLQAQGYPGAQVGLGDPPAHVTPVFEDAPVGYDVLRRREYPALADQLDALWKALGPTAPPGSEARQMYDQIQAVKAKHPKPTPPA